jgi:hypothetical protein
MTIPSAPTRILTLTVMLGILLTFCSAQTRANTIAVSFNDYSRAVRTVDITFGWSFTLNKPITLTDLGLWDGNNQNPFDATGDGFASSHPVSIWTSEGTLITSATLSAGKSGTLDNGFRFVSVVPIVLQPGDYEMVVTLVLSMIGVLPRLMDYHLPRLSFTQADWLDGNGFPVGDFVGFPPGFFGPNLQFITSTQRVADYGTTLTLFVVGIAALLGFRWRCVPGFSALLSNRFLAGVTSHPFDLRILEHRDVKLRRIFRLIIEPKKWSDPLHGKILTTNPPAFARLRRGRH